ncbi:MAG: hypothetical protein A07HR60_00126 [uncultured archaeon A07HR60]|jgi:hypothetical protein|nr:MAG: hypothetical protein A07HR60_00126 [uncultured archaeon A07HR60]
MSYPVTYHCPECETIVELHRDGYLADKSVTPYPFEGWQYASPQESFEDEEFDGVRFVCGADGTVRDPDADGCGEPFYLSFVRFESGSEVEPTAGAESEHVEISGPDPDSPRGPPEPGDGGFWQ